MLAAAYAAGAHGRRPVPSAGALYPLELYVVAAAVNGLDRGIYHFNPFRLRLARLGSFSWPEVRGGARRSRGARPRLRSRRRDGRLRTLADQVRPARLPVRTARGRPLVQNAVLAATELGLPALPLGGFYDRLLDEIVGADSLDEATVHALVLGGAV